MATEIQDQLAGNKQNKQKIKLHQRKIFFKK